MSNIGNKIGHRYDQIVSYFKCNPFGSKPIDLTALSCLPPVDRCLILERVAKECGADVIVLIDKLSMAYLKAGWSDLAEMFVRACCRKGVIMPAHYYMFMDKLSGLSVYGVSQGYEDALDKLPRMNGALEGLIRDLCETYRGQEVFSGVDVSSPYDARDVEAFKEERLNFINSI